MPKLVKAQLIELTQDFNKEKSDGQKVEVQFNPESLKLTFANQLVQPEGGDKGRGNAGRQFVGAGTTKLALQLWFDVTAMETAPVDDVRRLTQRVIYFMTPQPSVQEADKLAPPGVRFQWGSFIFDGMVEGLEENIEFFSPEGKPLRASVTLTLSQQKILKVEFAGSGRVSAGQRPMKSAKSGQSLQTMAAQGGKQDWQSIAAANAIEDPLRLPAGRLIDLNAGVNGGASLGFGASAGASASLGLGGALSGGASGTVSGSVSGSAGVSGGIGR